MLGRQVLIIAALLAVFQRGEAAELYEGDGVICDYHLDGEIAEGDIWKKGFSGWFRLAQM